MKLLRRLVIFVGVVFVGLVLLLAFVPEREGSSCADGLLACLDADDEGQGSPRASGSTAAVAAVSGEWDERYRALRDEAIRNVGWIAGNAEGQAVWGEVGPMVTEGGVWYEVVLVRSPAEAETTTAFANVGLYREWRERGRDQPYNPAEADSRAERLNQIFVELAEMMRDL